jgi:ribose transport system substrate-binding protein
MIITKRIIYLFIILIISLFMMGLSVVGCAEVVEEPTEEPAEEVAEEPAEEVAEEPAEEPAEEEVQIGKIGFTCLTYNNPFFIKVRDAIKEVVEANGGTLIEVDGQSNAAVQVAGVENMLAQGVDGIIMNPVETTPLESLVAQANELGIPIIAVDREVTGGEVASTVTSDNYMAGQVVGEYVVERLGEGKVCVIDYPSVSIGLQRVEGFVGVLEKYNFEFLAFQKGGSVEEGLASTEVWLQQFPEIDVIFAINDPGGLGALIALEEAGRDDETFVVGIDGSDEAIEAMKEGRSYAASAAQDPTMMGKMAAENLIKVIKGEEVEEHIQIPTPLITKESVTE